jgi:hypothetical protein
MLSIIVNSTFLLLFDSNALDSAIFSSLTKEKRKSRWEPVEETPAKKIEPVSDATNGGRSNTRYNRLDATSKIVMFFFAFP